MPNKARFSITVDPRVMRRVDRLAKAMNRSRSATIEKLLNDGVEDTEMFVKAMTNPVLVEAFGKAFASRDVMRTMAATIGQELSDDQMQLFTKAMSRIGREVGTK